MKLAAVVLIATGTAIVLGACLWVSLALPVRTELSRTADSNTYVDFNLWGQSVWASMQNRGEPKWGEYGPFPGHVRHGEWTRVTKDDDGKLSQVQIWFVNGQEVSSEEWERER